MDKAATIRASAGNEGPGATVKAGPEQGPGAAARLGQRHEGCRGEPEAAPKQGLRLGVRHHGASWDQGLSGGVGPACTQELQAGARAGARAKGKSVQGPK